MLYPTALLALFGAAWRTQPLFSETQIALLGIGAVSVIVLLFVEISCRKKKRQNRRELFDTTAPNALQRIIRFRTQNGSDRLEGTFRVEFLQGQAISSVHIPFCPAFDAAPKVEVFVIDSDDARATVVQTQPFGVRIDVKRGAKTILHLAVIAEG